MGYSESSFRKMDHYIDRTSDSICIKISDDCLNGNICLWYNIFLNIKDHKENIFEHEFTGDNLTIKYEYLYSMDYLSNIVSAYRLTGNPEYKNFFCRIIDQYYDYVRKCNYSIHTIFKYSRTHAYELPVYAQTVLFIKAIDVFGSIPHQSDFFRLMYEFAEWLTDKKNRILENNHGLFQILPLLHLSVMFGNDSWSKTAIEHLIELFNVSYYNDFTNKENSLIYFDYNNSLYTKAADFCSYYNISGAEKIEDKLNKAKDALITFAHRDKSFPVIGDGRVFVGESCSNVSALFPDIGISVIKCGNVYLSYKGKCERQDHAHADISSITARYKDIDLIVDSGHYNYDRYTPINRYVRSAAGHSGIVPINADNLFQWDFCSAVSFSDVLGFECRQNSAFVKGTYTINGIKFIREISVSENEIIVSDSFDCERPEVIRQRFVIPQKLLPECRFTVSKRLLETGFSGVRFKFEINTDIEDSFTQVNFGTAAPQYGEYETTMLLDTIMQNTLSGKITAKITITEE